MVFSRSLSSLDDLNFTSLKWMDSARISFFSITGRLFSETLKVPIPSSSTL